MRQFVTLRDSYLHLERQLIKLRDSYLHLQTATYTYRQLLTLTDSYLPFDTLLTHRDSYLQPPTYPIKEPLFVLVTFVIGSPFKLGCCLNLGLGLVIKNVLLGGIASKQTMVHTSWGEGLQLCFSQRY